MKPSPSSTDSNNPGPPVRLELWEDDRVEDWHPFSSTRPAGELLFGCLTLRERIEAALGQAVEGYVGAPWLSGFDEPGVPPVESPPASDPRPRLVVSSRWVPDLPGEAGPAPVREAPTPEDAEPDPRSDPTLDAGPGLRDLAPLVAGPMPEAPVRIELGPGPDWLVGWLLPPGHPIPDPSAPAAFSDEMDVIEVDGGLLESPWALMAGNADRISRDLMDAGLPAGRAAFNAPDGVRVLGSFPVTAGRDVRVEPGAVLDSRSGPIHLSDGVRVEPLSHLSGPAFIGPDSHLLGGRVGSLSTGPVCKIQGEVSDAVFLGYTNKAHDGYVGHALVGRWVNLGAFTTNSDLKNNYGTVRVNIGPHRVVDTGLLKVGVLLGDHVKTAIGTLLNTGTVVGAGSNLFGTEMPPKWVPPFSWGSSGTAPFRLDAFLDTAARSMERRGIRLTEGMAGVLTRAWTAEHGAIHPPGTQEGAHGSARDGAGDGGAPQE